MATQQTTSINKKAEMIYCERCGEDYSATYRRCPFCDERPGRRIDERGARGPLQVAVLIVTLVIILAAAFIVFSKVAPLLTSRVPAEPSTPGVEQPSEPSTQTPEIVLPDVTDKTDPNAVPASAIVLSRTDITLVHGETYTLAATVAPSNTTDAVVWSSDRPDLVDVGQDGSVTNKNATGEKVAVNVTATAGGVTATCVVRCNSGAVIPVNPGNPNSGEPVSSGTSGKVSGAGNGLNVRSGPGSEHAKVASISNGTTVTILEDTGTGWYKIDYGNGKVGYASSTYIKPSGTVSSGSSSTSSGSSTSASSSSSSSSGSGSSSSASSGATISGKTPAKVVGAANGLNVRSGPGSNYEKVASISNGNSVTILENAGNGFYKIDYGNGKIGYASVNYIQPK